MRETTVPRTLAAIVLLLSLAMLIPLGGAVATMLRGQPVAPAAWSVPLVILATGLALMSFLPRIHSVGSTLYLSAFALWILAAGYFFFISR